MLQLQPIWIDEDPAQEMYANPDCQELFKSYPSYYSKAGYDPPWIGYFVIRDHTVVGAGGFTGKPRDGKVEIAYGTFKDYEGQGISSFTCRQLVEIAKAADPSLTITAKTAPEENASTAILKKNGFVYTGVVQDDDIGEAWGWTYREATMK
jgi:[ribosomal protein S5]-alanine N-acetyltransferase